MPCDHEINTAIEGALTLAIAKDKSLGLDYRKVPCPSFSISSLSIEIDVKEDEGLVPNVGQPEEDTDMDDVEERESELALVDSNEDTVAEDSVIVSTGAMAGKTFQHVNLSPESIYCKARNGKGEKKKAYLCSIY